MIFEWNLNFGFYETALHAAIENKNIDIVKILLENPKIDVNVKTI